MPTEQAFQPHKAARRRFRLSYPMSQVVKNNLLDKSDHHFDYGCGYGDDVYFLNQQGYQSIGYDPFYHSDKKPIRSDVVTLFYVLNFIEDVLERDQILIQAYQLADKRLITSAIVNSYHGETKFKDGFITKSHNFATYFSKKIHLKDYLEIVTGTTAQNIGSGVYCTEKSDVFTMPYHAIGRNDRLYLADLLVEQIDSLQQQIIPAKGSRIEPYNVRGNQYLRLRSPKPFNLNGNMQSVLYIGFPNSPKHLLAIAALQRRAVLDIALKRLDHLHSNDKPDGIPPRTGASLLQ